MTIEDVNIIDGMGIDAKDEEIILMISDHLPWSDERAHFGALEAKLGRYIDFIKSGQLLEEQPQALGLKKRIELIYQFEPSNSALVVLRTIATQLKELDIQFSYTTLPTPY